MPRTCRACGSWRKARASSAWIDPVAWQLHHHPCRQGDRDLRAPAAPRRHRAPLTTATACPSTRARPSARPRRRAVLERARRQPEGMMAELAVIGVGLIGGWFGMALEASGTSGPVVGFGRNAANLQAALARGAIDAIEPDASAAARDADLVLIATPVAQFFPRKSSLAIGSRLEARLPGHGRRQHQARRGRGRTQGTRRQNARSSCRRIPSPARSGAGPMPQPRPSCSRAARVVLTPLTENAESFRGGRRSRLVRRAARRSSRMDAEEHDAVLAAVSHLPHLLAYALVHDVAKRNNSAQLFSFAAGGFRDFTRIASSHPEMWRDICVANRDRAAAGVEALCQRARHRSAS